VIFTDTVFYSPARPLEIGPLQSVRSDAHRRTHDQLCLLWRDYLTGVPLFPALRPTVRDRLSVPGGLRDWIFQSIRQQVNPYGYKISIKAVSGSRSFCNEPDICPGPRIDDGWRRRSRCQAPA
jgi:hypothetical protein